MGCGWAADGPRMGCGWAAGQFFCSFLALPSERIIAHWPVGAPRRIPAAQATKNIQNPKFLTLSIPLIPSDLLRISTFSSAVQLR